MVDLAAKPVTVLVVALKVVLVVKLTVAHFGRDEHFDEFKNVAVSVAFEFPCFTTSQTGFPFG